MKAAATAAERGHSVVLCEASPRLGGQVGLAQLLPDRSEFGGLIGNLEREMALAGVEVKLNIRVDALLVEQLRAEAVVIATGALPCAPTIDGRAGAHVVGAWDVLTAKANPPSG
jgi:NADPH-dependent 2,4-dienoyl-CoA reductase/sulfur reductase-like enzyme